MQFKQKYKIWGSWVCGVLVFGFALVLTPRFWVDSSASLLSERVPVQSIQPFHESAFSNYDDNIKSTGCITDRTPEHSVVLNRSDQPAPNTFDDCTHADSIVTTDATNEI